MNTGRSKQKKNSTRLSSWPLRRSTMLPPKSTPPARKTVMRPRAAPSKPPELTQKQLSNFLAGMNLANNNKGNFTPLYLRAMNYVHSTRPRDRAAVNNLLDGMNIALGEPTLSKNDISSLFHNKFLPYNGNNNSNRRTGRSTRKKKK